MTMPNHAAATVRQPEIFHGGEERLGLHLDRLREKLPGTQTQDAGQGIIDLIRLTKPDNAAILPWRIALLERFWQARHPPRYAAYLIPSSPSFPLSSSGLPSGCRRFRRCAAHRVVSR